eukprot:10629836-Lingulodinium_polyedra.AAC.1
MVSLARSVGIPNRSCNSSAETSACCCGPPMRFPGRLLRFVERAGRLLRFVGNCWRRGLGTSQPL